EEVSNFSAVGFASVDVAQNGALVYAWGNTLVSSTLAWLGSVGLAQPLRATAADYYGSFAFSPDGKRLALGINADGNADVWMYEWERDTMTRLTFPPGDDSYPVWAPDARHIVIASERYGGVPNLYWMRSDGSGDAVRLTESKSLQVPCSFSPNGKWLAFE